MSGPEPTVDQRWRAARNLLAIRLDNLGDVLVTTPAIHAIRRSLPEARLTLLASPAGAQAGRLNPDLDEVIVYEAPWVDPWSRLPHDSGREQTMVACLRERAFDAAIVFTSFRQSPLPAAYLCYLADVPLRLAASIDGPGSLLTTRHKHPPTMMHEVERGLDLVGAVGLRTEDLDLVLRVPPAARPRAESRWRGGEPLVVVHPGCTMPARTYPSELYVEVIDLLARRLGARLVRTGSEQERDLVDWIFTRLGPRARRSTERVAGELEFPDLCALIEAADLTITNNTGPMHVAAAVKTPVVALFALTNPPEQWGPWRVPHRLLFHEVPCRLCYSRVCPHGQECLRLVRPGDVLAAAVDLLDDAAAGRRFAGRSPDRWSGDVASDPVPLEAVG